MAHRVRVLTWSGLALVVIALLVVGMVWWILRSNTHPERQTPASAALTTTTTVTPATDKSVTRVHAHNLLLQKGPDFRIYVRWLDGNLARTHRTTNPSFDNLDSFDLNIQTGVVRANIGDIGHLLNAAVTNSPLKNMTLVADHDNLKLTGTLHKVVSLPVQVIASVAANPDNRIRVHIVKMDVLKVPLKGLFGIFHVSAADLLKTNIDGLEVKGNDLYLDTHKLLPPPHIRGQLTQVSVDSPDLQITYGNAAKEVERVELWRNFLSLKGGTIDFGKLTMNTVDLMMIDISKDPWFDLDLANYRQQFTSGYTRITPDSGLQIFMPDRRDIKPQPATQNDDIAWFKNRNIPPPPQITASVHHK